MGKARDLARLSPNSSGLLPNANIEEVAATKLTGRVSDTNAPSGSVIQIAYATVNASSEVALSSGGTWDTATVSITPTFANSTIALFHNPSFLYRGSSSSNNWLRIYVRTNGSTGQLIKDWSCYADVTTVAGFRQDRDLAYFYVPNSTSTQTLGFRFVQGSGSPSIVGDGETRYVWAMEIAP
jgi:hypothetical protein